MIFLQSSSSPSPSLANTPPASPPPGWLDWGIALAICLFVGRTLFDWFKQKDQSEAELTHTLIGDMRSERRESLTTQSEILGKLNTSQERTAKTLTLISDRLNDISVASQQDKRDVAVLVIELRALRDSQVILVEQVRALHDRLDRMNIPRAGS
jgi:hypothetical protein